MKLPRLALLAGVAGLVLAVPAQAQHQGHTMPMPPPAKKPTPKKPAAKKPAAKKPAAKKPAAKKPAAKKPAAKKKTPVAPADPHAGHDMSQMPAEPSAPAQTPMPQGQGMPEMPGHDMTTMPQGQAMPAMPGHDMGAMPGMATPAGTDLPAGSAPPPAVPTDNAADAVYGPEAMHPGRHHLQQFHGGQKLFQVLSNIAEYQVRSGRDGYRWDVEAWYGGDIDRLWLKTEGEGAFGGPLDGAETQALYSHAIDPYFNLQGGLRYDLKPNPSRVYAAFGIEGLAPSFFELEAFGYLSNKGELMAEVEGYYDQRITQRLILQPRAEIDFAAQNSREIGVGAGLSNAEIGLRLRYDIRREFAPYFGVQYQRAFGRTRRYLRDEGEDPDGWSLLAGIRLWM